MLILKEPIHLHTAQPLTMAHDSFGERIIGNYEILGARYEPKDLLFLLTAPPELPDDLGGMTTIVEDTSVSNTQNVTMDVVNHVVNRILLDGTGSFTYQDQVYITSVLNRLGITNVAQFMEEVRRLRVENESVVHMTQLYENQLQQLLARQAAGEESVRLPLPAERGEEEDGVRTRDPALTMALSILNRLDTPRIYETVHAFRQNWTVNDSVVQQNTLRLTEQLRFSNAIELAEMKQRVFQEPEITLLNHWNRYEHYDVAMPAATEAQVLRQAAAAALLTAVDNTLVEVLNCPQFHQQWLRVDNSLWQTAENTLNRFERYHSWEGITAPETPPPVNREWRYFAQELQEYESLEQQVLALPGTETVRTDSRTAYPQLTRPTGSVSDLPPVERKLLVPGETPEEGEEAAVERQHELRQERVLRDTVERMLLESAPRRSTDRSSSDQPIQPRPDQLSPVERKLLVPGKTPENQGETVVERELQTQREQLIHSTVEQVLRDSAPRRGGEPGQTGTPVPSGPEQLPPVEQKLLTPSQAEEVAPEVLTQELTRIDRENREKLERVTQDIASQPVRLPEPLGAPDIQRTMRDALRALDDPEAVLRELPFAPAEMTMASQYTPEEEALLRQASPEDRALYERVLALSRDPEGAIARGLARPANMGSFQAELMQANREQAVELEHRELPDQAETERLLQQSETVLERFQQVPGPHTVMKELADRRSALKFIHKEAAPDITEELMERLQENRTQSLVSQHEDERVTEHSSHTTNLNQTQRQVVRSTTADVTELVNRTLASQMRTISDQVYRQMEKKLQLERSRRGRF